MEIIAGMCVVLLGGLYVLGAYFFAELLSGVFHWWEDRYGNPDWPILGKYVIQPNIEHHQYPRKFCKGNYWQRNYTTLMPSLLLALIAFSYGEYFLCLTFCFMSQANEMHSWTHTKTNKFIRSLQKIGILQSHRQHAIHHKRPYDKYYCVMTNYLNPVLASIGYWDALEWLLSLFNIHPREERQIY